MAELPPRRSALAAVYRAGESGAPDPGGPGVTLVERRHLAVVQVAAVGASHDAVARALHAGLGLELPLVPNRAAVAGALLALWVGPGRALIVARGRPDLATALGHVLAGAGAAVTDLSHGRTVLRLTGPHARALLAKGCGLDFHPRVFPAGRCAQSHFEKIALLVHALDEAPVLDLYVARSFARSLWERLIEGAREFGCGVLE